MDGEGRKRDKMKAMGNMIGRRVGDVASTAASKAGDVASTAASKAATASREAHDVLTEKLHETKVRAESESVLGEATHVLDVEVITAADLREDMIVQAMATCDPYCVLVVSKPCMSWDEKCVFGRATTRVIPRQRNPHWNSRISLKMRQVPKEAQLILRVMDSKTMQSDMSLGEATVSLSEAPSGARCTQVFSGGIATLCLRWALHAVTEESPPMLPRGTDAFEAALVFWDCDNNNNSKSAELCWGPALVEKLHSCDTAHVNELLMQAPLRSLFGAHTSSAVVPALTSMLPTLEPIVRARLAGALVGRLGSARAPEEHLLHQLFVNSTGSDLYELKRLINTGGLGSCLLRFTHSVFSDSDRAALSAHFREEASRAPELRSLHVLSDIDQTFWVGNFGVGGPKFPGGPIPGARPLLNALGGQLTFLSARPSVFEAQTRRDILDAGVSEAGLLTGELQAVLQAAFSGTKGAAAMGAKKAQVFNIFAALHPEGRFVFIGDSGEGDVDFAEGLFMGGSSAAEGEPPVALGTLALIHDVVGKDGMVPQTSADRRAELQGRGIHVFDCYVGAALELHRVGLLDAAGLRRATQGCEKEFVKLSPSSFASEAVFCARRSELLRDLDRADAVLEAAGLERVRRRIPPEF